MGFLKRGAKDEQGDSRQEDEEAYERMFVKIGRDFVHKEDLARMLSGMMELLDPDGLSPQDHESDTAARSKAREYKNVIDSGKDGSKIYKDLIDMDK